MPNYYLSYVNRSTVLSEDELRGTMIMHDHNSVPFPLAANPVSSGCPRRAPSAQVGSDQSDVGSQLGPYRLEALLGEGGMGTVYRAKDERLGRLVAIKVSHIWLRGRLEREARSISALNHPHVCTLYDVGPNYLVMELLDGETLSGRLRRGPLPIDQVLRFGAQMADVLSEAHSLGITHRDLKPSNIMLTKNGVKVLDFGLAKFVPEGTERETETQTVSLAILGTPSYMAPEQYEGKSSDARTDIFALGLILYEMATGKRAFHGANRASLAAQLIRDQPEQMDSVPECVTRVIARCLAKNPSDRWQSAIEIKAELDRTAQSRESIRLRGNSLWSGMWLRRILMMPLENLASACKI